MIPHTRLVNIPPVPGTSRSSSSNAEQKEQFCLHLLSPPVSCRGRCGSEYYRGHTCQCDSTCLAYDECCADYESQCTTGKTPPSSRLQRQGGHLNAPRGRPTKPQTRLSACARLATETSCQGRCGEAFRRGRRCSCDLDCQKFKQCCSDFQSYCEEAAGEPGSLFAQRSAGSVRGSRLSRARGGRLWSPALR